MGRRGLIAAVLIVLLGGLAWFTLRDGEPADPDGGSRDRPEENEVDRGTNGKPPVVEPVRGQAAVQALRDGPSGDEALAELARSTEGVKEILAALALSETVEERALLQLHLVLGGTAAGRDAVLANARGEGRERDRIPALLALAGGDDAAANVLADLLLAKRVDDLVLVAAHALALRADDRSFLALEDAVVRTKSPEDRILLYSALENAPGAGRPGERFMALLTGAGGRTGLTGTDTGRGPYRRFVDRIAAEDDVRAARTAMEVLLHLPGPDSTEGALQIWRRSEGEARRDLTDAALLGFEPNRTGAPAGLVAIAREVKGEERAQVKERVLTRLQECRDRGAVPTLREWAQSEDDPGLRERIEEQIRRIEEEPEPR